MNDRSDGTDTEIAARFADLGTLDVPRHLDLDAVRSGGRRRLRRRRLLAGTATAGTAAAAVASIVAISGALLTDPGQGSSEAPAAGTSQAPTASPTRKPSTPATPPGPINGPRGGSQMVWMTRWQQEMKAHDLTLSASSAMHDSKSAETFGAVRRGGSVGYVAFIGNVDPAGVLKARQNPCRIDRFPKGGTGASCRQQGDYWVKTYRDSNQGRVVLVRVVTDRADVLLAQSTAFPSYQPSSSDSTKLLPWDNRDPVYPEDPSRKRTWPALEDAPLPSEQLAAVARELADSAPR